MTTLIARINTTKSRLPTPAASRLKVTAEAETGDLGASISTIINSRQTTTVRRFLSAEGVQQVFVCKKETPGTAEGWLTSAGDGIVGFDPICFKNFSPSETKIIVEHEMWHIYLCHFFPEFNPSEYMSSHEHENDYVTPNFFSHFEHFFLTITMLKAGRINFVLKEKKQRLPQTLAGLNPSYLRQALVAISMGSLFDTVFPLRLYRQTQEAAEENLATIKKAMIQASNAATFARSYEIAERILSLCLADNNDFKIEGFMAETVGILKEVRGLWPFRYSAEMLS